ncbi:helix-turn-helix domain-containing protein [Oceanisphaera sp. DM8]|uniref:Helix-turn-helix domain-containing protein n=1 Tax=Oceanisphaera pacifica TaxID=2818389 RepID=A0ABS3NJD0_9GAMM|nr:helix-turn-helix domain-containing protein [Oceanisphaera pacifica]
MNRNSVNKWVANFLQHGLAGLESVRPPGRPATLSTEQLSLLSDYIDQQSKKTVVDAYKVLIFRPILKKNLGYLIRSPIYTASFTSSDFLGSAVVHAILSRISKHKSLLKKVQAEDDTYHSWSCCTQQRRYLISR